MCKELYQIPALLPDKVVVSCKPFLAANILVANPFKIKERNWENLARQTYSVNVSPRVLVMEPYVVRGGHQD